MWRRRRHQCYEDPSNSFRLHLHSVPVDFVAAAAVVVVVAAAGVGPVGGQIVVQRVGVGTS